MNELLTIAQTAEKAKVCEMTVRRAIKAQVLPALRFGRALRVDESELEEYLRRERATTSTATAEAAR
jgi:excisionase family DNA binding protein